MTGVKYDAGKPRMELIPMDSIVAIAEVLTFGAKKYGDRNWEAGIEPGRVIGALLRHLAAHMSGEEYDRETGLRHVAHAGCNALMLIALVSRKPKKTYSGEY